MFGLSENDHKLLLSLVINPLKERGARVFIFGSRARGNHHPFSDIDILYIEGSNAISDIDIAKIKEDIEDSNITIKVDLVNSKSLASSYRPSVEKDQIEI